MKYDDAVNNMIQGYFRKIQALRKKIRQKAPSVIHEVLCEMGKKRPRASKLSNVYYLDYDRSEETMLWTPFDNKDPKDRKDLNAFQSYNVDLYKEMRLKKLQQTPGYIAWSVLYNRAGYAWNAQGPASVNPNLDRELGYGSCIHIPLSKAYRCDDAKKGGTGIVIGDIILAHPDRNGIFDNVQNKEKRREATDKIAYKLYRACQLGEAYKRLANQRNSLRPLRNAIKKEFSYFFDTNLQIEYSKAVDQLSSRLSGESGKKPLMDFLYLLPNMLSSARQAVIPMEQIIDKVYSQATPLLYWIKTLQKGEPFFSAMGDYREHLRHIISVYMLGVIALASGYDLFVRECFEKHLKRIDFDKKKTSAWTPEVLLLAMWTVVAFSHDALYALYKTHHAVRTLAGKYDGTGKKTSPKGRKKNRTQGQLYDSELLAYLQPVAKHLVDMEILGQSPATKGRANYDRISQTLSGLFTLRDEHDTLAGIQLEIALMKSSTSSSSSQELWKWLSKKLAVVDKTRYYRNVITTAVAYHHGWKKDVELLVGTKGFQMPTLYLEMHPILVLLVLCDGVHNWGRKMEAKQLNQIRFNSFRFQKKKMTFLLDLDCNTKEAKTIVDGYKKHFTKLFKRKISSQGTWEINIGFSNEHWYIDRRLDLM